MPNHRVSNLDDSSLAGDTMNVKRIGMASTSEVPTELSRTEFNALVSELYQHLYDLVFLRTHPLADILVPDSETARKDRGWRLQDLLLEAIKELDPGPGAAPFSREWRRHRLMVRRYRNGLEPPVVMQELAISRRQYYRDHETAVEAIAGVLWERYLDNTRTAQAPARIVAETSPVDHLELLRLEAARTTQAERYTRPADVASGAFALLEDRVRQRGIIVKMDLAESPARVAIEKGLLRQILLGVAGYLIERSQNATLRLVERVDGPEVKLRLTMAPPDAMRSTTPEEVAERQAAFSEMAALGGAHLVPIDERGSVSGFELHLPVDAQRTVLVVDDNEDTLELLRRFLAPHHYRVVTARSVPEALELAIQVQPFVVIVDLMLPGQDGWDLLQTLLNRPETRRIPVLICSVLKQKELALSLGATAFLDKPVTEEVLLAALAALERA
jgi:CheY-like chemotaxis protein